MAPQDYTRRSFQAAAALIAVLVCVAFIPPQTICGIPLRRANILSDVLRFDDKEAADETLPELDDEFSGDFHRFAGQLDAGEAPLPADSIAAEPPTRCPPHRSSLSNGRPPTANRRRSLLRAIPHGY